MKIAVLYICTGKYSIFWHGFHSSAESYFLPDCQKTYFVFSDTANIESNDRVKLIEQKKLGWPYDTLMRFHLFSSISDELQSFDYIFFFNANIRFRKIVDQSILQSEKGIADLIVVKHPFFDWVTNPKDFPYERNKKSTAYIAKKDGKHYVFGAFNGGRKTAYLKLIQTLKARIDQDLKKDLIAIWHDESQLNRYILDTSDNISFLTYDYAFPEGHDLPLKENIFVELLDKSHFGGHDFLREKENSIPVVATKASFLSRLKNKLRIG